MSICNRSTVLHSRAFVRVSVYRSKLHRVIVQCDVIKLHTSLPSTLLISKSINLFNTLNISSFIICLRLASCFDIDRNAPAQRNRVVKFSESHNAITGSKTCPAARPSPCVSIAKLFKASIHDCLVLWFLDLDILTSNWTAFCRITAAFSSPVHADK